MERICIYPGSFDPATIGHVDIIRRAAALFDRVIVAVLHNPAKQGCFTVEERVTMLENACEKIPGVEVRAFSGLLVDAVKATGAHAVVRGLRNPADFENEKTMAHINAELLPGMETVFLLTRPGQGHISSSAVRELALFHGRFEDYVPESSIETIRRRFE